VSEFLIPLIAGRRKYLKNMLNDRGVRSADTRIADRRKYLKNMITDKGVRIYDTRIAGRRKYLKIY
jgi:hypothetical protein